jgi:putative oxygen-independent coproporphyrinogen III oxidase
VRPALYVHIPFCTSKCDYCDFYSLVSCSLDTEKALVRALLDDLDRSMCHFEITGFSTVYIGGGTPSALCIESLSLLLDGIGKCTAGSPLEWTVEANPGGCTKDFVALMQEKGVDRLSLGVQSLFTPSRRYMGRRGESKPLREGIELVKNQWSGRLSFDFIRDLPEDFSCSIERELELLNVPAADHLSLYDLTVEDSTPLAKRLKQDLDGRREGNEDGLRRPDSVALLESKGFRRYEVSNYARPGGESMHNLAYWEMQPYLGIGPAAASLLPEGGGWSRYSVPADLFRYIDDGAVFREKEVLSREEFFMEHLIMGMRQVRGVLLSRVEERFGRRLESIIPRTLSDWGSEEGLKTEHGRLLLCGKAFMYQNRFLLDAWRELELGSPFA